MINSGRLAVDTGRRLLKHITEGALTTLLGGKFHTLVTRCQKQLYL